MMVYIKNIYCLIALFNSIDKSGSYFFYDQQWYDKRMPLVVYSLLVGLKGQQRRAVATCSSGNGKASELRSLGMPTDQR